MEGSSNAPSNTSSQGQAQNKEPSGSAAPNAGPLMQEIETARTALKTALLQIGLILRFHRDVRSLGVDSYATKSPQSMTNALQQAIKHYEEACETMERKILYARQALAIQLTKETLQAEDDSAPLKVSPLPAKLEDKDMEVDKAPTTEPVVAALEPVQTRGSGTIDLTADSPDDSAPKTAAEGSGPTAQPIVTTIIDDDDMEDLFGPPTGSASAGTTPLTAPAADGATKTIVQPSPHPILSEPESSTAVSKAADPTSGNTASTIQNKEVPLSTSSAFDAMQSVITSNNQAANEQDSAQQFDFSSLSATDFNALLADLTQNSTGSGNDLLAGLDVDLSGIFDASTTNAT